MITAIDHHLYVEASEIVIKSTFLPGYYNGDVKSKNKSDWNKFCETMAVQRYLLKFLLEDLSDWTSFNFYWTISKIFKFSFQHTSTMKFDPQGTHREESTISCKLLHLLNIYIYGNIQNPANLISPTYPSIFIQGKTVSEGENVVDNEVEK